MFRFLRSHLSPEHTRAPDDLSDFFNYAQTIRHGFPSGASAIAVDRVLSLVAIGTQQGHVYVLGSGQVLFSASVPSKAPIAHLYFAHGTGCFIALCDDQSFHRFKITDDSIVVETVQPETRLKRITSCEMYQKRDLSDARLLIGTVTGNVFSIKIDSLEMTTYIIYEETILQRLPDAARENRSIDGMSVNPQERRQVLLVLDFKCVVLYDVMVHEVQRVIMQTSPVQDVSWCSDGVQFMLSHADGAYSRWSSRSEQPVDGPHVIFGPFPCQPVHKIVCTATTLGETMLFTGGMPRASYGDRFTITAKRGEKVAVFDFSSPIKDFALLPESSNHTSEQHSMNAFVVVLCEQEVVVLDIGDKQWRPLQLAWLHALHASQITTMALVADAEEHVWKALEKAADQQQRHRSLSHRVWPSTPGIPSRSSAAAAIGAAPAASEDDRQILLTGHENGNVRVWSVGVNGVRLLSTVTTAREFAGYTEEDEPLRIAEERSAVRDSMYDSDSSDDNPGAEWPPFLKVGEYDPFCDDHRLAVQKLALDGATGQLAIAGRGGHVILYALADTVQEIVAGASVSPQLVDEAALPPHVKKLLPLPKRSETKRYESGYQPVSLQVAGTIESSWIQLRPASTVTALSLLSSRGLVAAGSEFGFAVVDLRTRQTLLTTSLLSGQDLLEAGALDDALSRFKSMKKSIRQSFRRKRKRNTATGAVESSPHSQPSLTGAGTAGSPNTLQTEKHFGEDDDDEEVFRPIERKIEARDERSNGLEQPVWLIKVLRFAKTAMLSSTTVNDCLWVGSNGGRILCYVVAPRDRPEETCRLIREVRLQHGAPVIDIQVCADPLSKNAFSGHRLVVFTEEQIRAFSLPALKTGRYKYKLTAIEGERIRKAAIVKLRSKADPHVDELFAAVLTNMGKISLFSLINPRKKVYANVLKTTDILGMTSCCIAPSGELFFLRPGGSELQRASIAAATRAATHHALALPRAASMANGCRAY